MLAHQFTEQGFCKWQNHIDNLKISYFHLAVIQQTPKQVLLYKMTPTDAPAAQLCLKSKMLESLTGSDEDVSLLK